MIEGQARRYNAGKQKWSYLHYKSLDPMLRVLDYGATKYSLYKNRNGRKINGIEFMALPEAEKQEWTLVESGAHNWKKPGLKPKEILESLQRHLAALMDGEDNDPESGQNHIGHIMCNAMFYEYHLNLQKHG